MFAHFDAQGKGVLTDDEMKSVMQKTMLPQQVCYQVWQLVNPNGEDLFSKEMFLVAMHLVFKKKAND
jgi:hypothetical protein